MRNKWENIKRIVKKREKLREEAEKAKGLTWWSASLSESSLKSLKSASKSSSEWMTSDVGFFKSDHRKPAVTRRDLAVTAAGMKSEIIAPPHIAPMKHKTQL